MERSRPGKAGQGKQGIHYVRASAAPRADISGQWLLQLLLDQAYGVSAWITDDNRFLEAQLRLRLRWNSQYVRADESHTSLAQTISDHCDIFGYERCLPMPQIVRSGIDRHRPSAGRRLIVKQLDVRRRGNRHQLRYHARVVEQVIQYFLRLTAI